MLDQRARSDRAVLAKQAPHEEGSMRGRHLLTAGELDAHDLSAILDTALEFKRTPPRPALQGRTLALLFEKPSLRTRLSFEVAMRRLGGEVSYLSRDEVGLGVREPVKDVARVLSRYVDVIAARTMLQSTIEELAAYATVPVVNALSDTEHPCQALADLLTIREHFGRLDGVRLAYIGDGNNVACSLAQVGTTAGMHIALASPPGYEIPMEVQSLAEERARASGGSLRLCERPQDAAADADVVYTDVWVSMGQEKETAARRAVFAPYQVDTELLRRAAPGAVVMHDLPAHRGEEITDEVMESEASIVFDQAENRMHAEQALLALILGSGANGFGEGGR